MTTFLDNLQSYLFDINNFLSGSVSGSDNTSILNTAPNFSIDNRTSTAYFPVSAARRSGKPFIIGIIPPDVTINYVPIDIMNEKITVTGSNVDGVSADVSGVKSKFRRGPAVAPKEIVPPPKPVFTPLKTVGASIYKNLISRGFSEADARRLTPLMTGQLGAETGGGGGLSTTAWNIGNIHAGSGGVGKTPTPPSGGLYYLGTDSEKGKSYPIYFKAAGSLDEATDKYVGDVLGGWPGVANAQDPASYTRALRPDLYPDVPSSLGGTRGPYFTAKPEEYNSSLQNSANIYNSQVGSKKYSSKAIDSVVFTNNYGGTNKDKPSPSVDVMTSGGITDAEGEDPLNSAPGRNIRITSDNRRLVDGRYQTNQLNAQADMIRRTPPLGLLVNPNNFSKSYSFDVDAPKGRRGHIPHIWLERPLSISCKGVTSAAFVINESGKGGLTGLNKIKSFSYRNMMSIVRTYKNNGYIYSDDSFGDQNGNIPLMALSLFIYFDGHVYLGSFNDFSIEETADKPYNYNYSFKFTSRYDLDTPNVIDDQVTGLV